MNDTPGSPEASSDLTGLPATLAGLWHRRPMWLRRLGALVHLLRLRLAHAVLLPELTPDQAFDLRQHVRLEGKLSNGYILMCALAAGIATLGLLQSSTAVVIGAMLVSPLMSPIAAMGFGFASLDGQRIRDAVKVVAIGALIGIATGVLLTWLSPIRNATPEILARTEPNLLDLAVALFSGIAGGYSTVIGKGGTAIGVAIATALMPPLTVVGYGIGVFQPMFAMGALLLFLTNLAAITFAFALIARMSGAARPLGKVEWTPRYIGILIAAFLALATPLSMTLMKLTNEARIRAAARSAIIEACGKKGVTIAQLDVKTSVFGQPSVNALVIARAYSANAEDQAEALLKADLDEEVQVTLQQVVAADVQSQARAMVDAAMERTTAGIAADVPPFKTIRQQINLPTHSLWTDRAQRIVYVEPIAAPDWTLADYQETEKTASAGITGWTVRLIPPIRTTLSVWAPDPAAAQGAETEGGAASAASQPSGTVLPERAVWALQRWGLARVRIAGEDSAALARMKSALEAVGIAATLPAPSPTPSPDEAPAPPSPVVTVSVFPASPSKLAAERSAKAAAEKAAQEAQAAETAPQASAPR